MTRRRCKIHESPAENGNGKAHNQHSGKLCFNDDIVYPTSGAAVCFGYLMAVRGLEGVVNGTYCSRSKDKPSQSCPRLHFCLLERISDTQMLAVFLKYAFSHVANWHEGASFHYLNAMQEAFPCKDERK
jgi:hypothetical protein